MPGKYTPQMQETMTRLGSKLPFEQAVEEVWYNQRTQVKEGTLRQMTYRHGEAAEALERAEVERMEQEGIRSEVKPKQLVISADGAFICLTTGEWREVKSLTVGEFERQWNQKKGLIEVKTRDISYFSRSYRVREFERYALAELARRGIDKARIVVTVNDGAEWIQSFVDYHTPKAVRILDFSHALGYVADAGKAVFGEETAEFQRWFRRMANQFKHKPPQGTLADLQLLQNKVASEEQTAKIDQALFYLTQRLDLIDYPHFLTKGYPIGSGSVESGHKVVVHSRLKQAGMRWAEPHVDPMLALRNLVCNGRWSAGWNQIVAFHWSQHRQKLRSQAARQRPVVPPVTLASVKVAPVVDTQIPASSAPPKFKQPHRPAPDHPWRQELWPTQESWRWN